MFSLGNFKCLELPRMQDFAPFTPELLGANRRPRDPRHNWAFCNFSFFHHFAKSHLILRPFGINNLHLAWFLVKQEWYLC